MRENGQELKMGDSKWVENPKRNICGSIRILSENFMKNGPAVFEKSRGHTDTQTHAHTHRHTYTQIKVGKG